jgi:hypothetical protein
VTGEWKEGRAALESRREVVESSQAVSRKVWQDSGIEKLTWRTTSGNPCPICRKLNGRVVGITESFMADGEQFEASGDSTYTVKGPRFHPPAHGSCMCVISPA